MYFPVLSTEFLVAARGLVPLPREACTVYRMGLGER